METEKEISDKEIKKMREALEKDHGREFTLEEATKAIWDLKTFARIAYGLFAEETRRQDRLKENPKGFHLDEGGTCSICRSSVSKENSWYDKYRLKCMPCQKAIDAKIIPNLMASLDIKMISIT